MQMHEEERINRDKRTTDHEKPNNLIELFYWLIQLAYKNIGTIEELLHFLCVMNALSAVITPVAAANSGARQEDPINKYKEPYCHKGQNGKDHCYEREARVYPAENGGERIHYEYNHARHDQGNPQAFIRDARFEGRPAVYHQDPQLHVNNPHGMFADPGARFGRRPDDDFDIIHHGNPVLGGNPAIQNNPHGNFGPMDRGHDPFGRQRQADELGQANDRIIQRFRRP